jgi:hypothetical protein
LLASGLWRWRKPFSILAVAVGIAGALVLSGAGYLGGELVYRHGLGIPTASLHELMEERDGRQQDDAADSTDFSGKNHTHSPGEKHEH